MGFYVDIAALQKAQEAYMKMVATAQSQLDTAKSGMNAIITSNSMYGEVGKAITNEINNVHNPVIVGLKNGLEFLGSEFSQTITDFQTLVEETSTTAVLAEETLDDAVKKLDEADEQHKTMDTNFQSIYDGISNLYHLNAPLSSTFYTNTQTARQYVQDTKNKVLAFDTMTSTSSTEQLFSALSSQMAAAGSVKSLSYSDPILTIFVGYEDLGQAIYEMDQQYAKAKAEAIEAAKRKAEQEAAEREASYRRHHPLQAWLKDRSDEIGSWWGDVVEGTRNLSLPQGVKDTLLFTEGFIGAAGSMISETAIGVVDFKQLIDIATIDGVNRLTGGQTPEWMKRDLKGTVDNLSSLIELGVGIIALTDPVAAIRGQVPTASYMDKAAYRAQQTGKALWNKLTHMDAYDVGGLTFEIASLFVSAAAVGKVAKGTNIGAKTAEMISLAKNSTKARILATVEKWGSKVDNILAKSNPVIRQFGETLLDTRIPAGLRQEALSFADEVGALSAFSDESKTLREVMHFSSQHVDDVATSAASKFSLNELEADAGAIISRYDDLYIYEFNGTTNPGPLADISSRPNRNFYGGRYSMKKLDSDTVLYRAGSGNNPMGQWFTTEPPISRAQVRIDTAVKDIWKTPNGVFTGQSPIDKVYEIKIPKGTIIYDGPVGSQGGIYQGGLDRRQIFIDSPWNIEGVEVLDSWSIKP
ncbi:T7SS effector LXG polymorphic toxin [Streptococcus azizii]|uniref:T7SS effector LXG polymorphic toxin n=1 Tax=Streptococcus azizii TaxID=1579424 RepID=UPI0015C34555|nr:T7SS effector LXG polymorphic toxin [Streptococcus azizii]